MGPHHPLSPVIKLGIPHPRKKERKKETTTATLYTDFDCWVDELITGQLVPELLSNECQPRLGPLYFWFQGHSKVPREKTKKLIVLTNTSISEENWESKSVHYIHHIFAHFMHIGAWHRHALQFYCRNAATASRVPILAIFDCKLFNIASATRSVSVCFDGSAPYSSTPRIDFNTKKLHMVIMNCCAHKRTSRHVPFQLISRLIEESFGLERLIEESCGFATDKYGH